MRQIIAFSILLFASLPWSVQAQLWLHEPTGSSTIAECNFNTATCGGQFSANNAGSIVSDATATKSPPSVLDNQLLQGQLSGGTQVYKNINPVIQSLYSGNYIKIDNNFVGIFSHVNKLYFLANLNLYVLANGDTAPFNLTLVYQQGGAGQPNNCHLPHSRSDCATWDATGGQVWFNSSCSITKGTYHFIEFLLRRSTTATSRDGLIQWWMDGALCYSSTLLNYPYDINYSDVANNTWTDLDCVGTGHCTTWDIYYDHAKISQAGSGTPLDTTPPAVPTGVMVTMLAATMIFGGIYGSLTTKPVSQHLLALGDHSVDSATLRTVAVHGGADGADAVYVVALPDRAGMSAAPVLAADPSPSAASPETEDAD